MKWSDSQPSEDCTEKSDAPLSPVLGAKAARLRKVPATWVRTVAATTFAVGSSLLVGFVHQSLSVLSPLTTLIAPHHRVPLNSIYYLYHLVRRPLLILDFTLTLLFDHLVLTTYYSAVILTSLFFWNVVLGSIILTLLPSRRAYVREKRNVRGPYDRNKQPRFRRR